MIIMLEGLDRTGKTTLGTALSEALDAPLIHKSAPTQPDALTEYLAPFAGYSPGNNLVLDRWHWGEMVWPHIFGRKSIMDERTFRYVDRAIANLGGLAVYCTSDLAGIRHRLMDEADEEVVLSPGRLAIARDRFEAVARRSAMPMIRYDLERTGFGAVVAHINWRAFITEAGVA